MSTWRFQYKVAHFGLLIWSRWVEWHPTSRSLVSLAHEVEMLRQRLSGATASSTTFADNSNTARMSFPKHTNWRGCGLITKWNETPSLLWITYVRRCIPAGCFTEFVKLLQAWNSYMPHFLHRIVFSVYPQSFTSKTSLLAFTWIIKMQPNQGYRKRSNNKWFPFLWGFSWFGGLVLPRPTSSPHHWCLALFFASVSWKKQEWFIKEWFTDSPNLSTPPNFKKNHPSPTVHLSISHAFFFSAKQIPEAPEPSTWRARPWVALLRTSGTIA